MENELSLMNRRGIIWMEGCTERGLSISNGLIDE